MAPTGHELCFSKISFSQGKVVAEIYFGTGNIKI